MARTVNGLWTGGGEPNYFIDQDAMVATMGRVLPNAQSQSESRGTFVEDIGIYYAWLRTPLRLCEWPRNT